jgi:hypothetical protein
VSRHSSASLSWEFSSSHPLIPSATHPNLGPKGGVWVCVNHLRETRAPGWGCGIGAVIGGLANTAGRALARAGFVGWRVAIGDTRG